MALLVLKFGGTSVASVETILHVANKVKALKEEGNRLAVVVSAMSGETNRLLDLASKFKVEKGKAVDFVLATGEQVSVGTVVFSFRVDRSSILPNGRLAGTCSNR